MQYILGDNVIIKKTDGEIDHKYAVDYEVYMGDVLKFGIQIKPKSYLGNVPYLRRARYANEQKFTAYKEKFGCPIYVIISKTSGEIQNMEIIAKLQRCLI